VRHGIAAQSRRINEELVVTDADELAELLAQRRRAGADRAATDAAIFARFGRTQAVMFTDLVGFSRLVEAFGILHFLQLIQESEALFLPLITAHRGLCLKREGDSLLAVFDQPRDALACAAAMVAATDAANPGRAPEERIAVCIGLGYGTVLRVGDHEVWGAEVNAASKLGEEMAQAGDILVTDPFHATVADQPWVPHGTLFETRPVYKLVNSAAAL
jgi:adenylate cyclase